MPLSSNDYDVSGSVYERKKTVQVCTIHEARRASARAREKINRHLSANGRFTLLSRAPIGGKDEEKKEEGERLSLDGVRARKKDQMGARRVWRM